MQEHEDKIKAEAVSAYPLPVPNNIMHASYQLLSPWTTLQVKVCLRFCHPHISFDILRNTLFTIAVISLI